MAAKTLPSAEYLRECFIYRPRIGDLRWRKTRPQGHFKTVQGWTKWSKYYAGKIAGNVDRGYVDINLGGTRFYAHRIIWKMMTGNDPIHQIDHRNEDKTDNRWCNLREATHSQNVWNVSRNGQRPLPRGVYQAIYGYSAGASHQNRHVYLGTFHTPEEAGAAYLAFVKKVRGRFANAA